MYRYRFPDGEPLLFGLRIRPSGERRGLAKRPRFVHDTDEGVVGGRGQAARERRRFHWAVTKCLSVNSMSRLANSLYVIVHLLRQQRSRR